MARKILDKSSPGDAEKFGADDIDYINELLTGIDQSGTDPVDINTTFKVRNGKLQISNSTDSNVSTIENSTAGADRVITLPNASTTLVGTNNTATLTNKTLTSPVISSISNSGTVTIPTGTNTLATTTSAQTLENKTMDSASNVFQNLVVYPDQRLVGFWMPVSTAGTGGSLMLNTGLTLPTGSSSGTHNFTPADGKFMTFTAGNIIDNYAGMRWTVNSAVIRNKKARFKCKFRLNETSDIRLMCGLINAGATQVSGDDPLSGRRGYMLGLRSTDTVFQIARNDDTGDTVFTNVSGSPAVDTNAHTIEIRADSDDTGFQYSFDGAAFSSVDTTDVPSSAGILQPHLYIQATTTAQPTVDFWYVILEQDA